MRHCFTVTFKLYLQSMYIAYTLRCVNVLQIQSRLNWNILPVFHMGANVKERPGLCTLLPSDDLSLPTHQSSGRIHQQQAWKQTA